MVNRSGENPRKISRMENWGSMNVSSGIQRMGKTSMEGLAKRKRITRAIQKRRPRMVMASKLTSRWRRKQLRNWRKLLRSPRALLARDHLALT
jgi:hypothetical protein